MTKSKFVMIWPPFLASNIFPLSIPFLVSYLKQKGVGDVEVYDMNIAYWKTIKPHWPLYMLFRRGYGILKNSGPALSFVCDFIKGKMSEVLENMETKGKGSIPWSLSDILTSLHQDGWLYERNKIRLLLEPVFTKECPALACISINYPEQIFFALTIARELKEKWGDNIHIVAGGAQVTKHIGYLIKSEDVYRLIDFFVVRDGEEPLFRLIKGFANRDFSNIPNLYHKDPNKAGVYIFSGSHFCLYPEDFTVPDFSGFDMGVYDDIFPLIVSKGCPWGQCAFCSYSGMHDRKFYGGSVEKTLEVIRGMENKYGSSSFYFLDDALRPAFLRSLSESLVRNNIKISWTSSIILSKEFEDPEFCRFLKQSGLSSVSFGLESVSRRLLKLMNKYHQDLDLEEIRKILAVIKSGGICISVCVFFGFPTETRQEAKATLDFLLGNIDLFDEVRMQTFCLEDLAPVFQEPEKFKITKIYTQDKSVGRRLSYRFETTEGMTQEETFKFTNEALAIFQKAFKKKRHVEH